MGALHPGAFHGDVWPGVRQYRSTGQPVSRSAGQPVSRSSGQPVNRAAGQRVSGSAGQPVSRSAGQPVSRATDTDQQDEVYWSDSSAYTSADEDATVDDLDRPVSLTDNVKCLCCQIICSKPVTDGCCVAELYKLMAACVIVGNA